MAQTEQCLDPDLGGHWGGESISDVGAQRAHSPTTLLCLLCSSYTGLLVVPSDHLRAFALAVPSSGPVLPTALPWMPPSHLIGPQFRYTSSEGVFLITLCWTLCNLLSLPHVFFLHLQCISFLIWFLNFLKFAFGQSPL